MRSATLFRTLTAMVVVSGLILSAVPAQQPAGENVVIRISGFNPAISIAGPIGDRFCAAHSGVKLQTELKQVGGLFSGAALVEGRADLAVLYGQRDILKHTYAKGRGSGLLKDAFKPGEVESHVLGWCAMVAVVNPKCELNELADADVRKILLSLRNTNNPDPFKSRGLSYKRDMFGCGMEMGQLILGEDKLVSLAGMQAVFDRAKLVGEVAGDPKLVAFMALDEAVASSGMKVLPLRFDGKLVAPSIRTVVSGEYRYQICMLLAIHPKASPAAREFAKELLGPEFARQLDSRNCWITSESKWQSSPAVAFDQAWPAPTTAPEAPRAAIAGAAAVLPLTVVSQHFMLAGPAEQQAYELAVQDGIAADKRLKLVDRGKLTRVLAERKADLAAAGGAGPGQPIIAADVLVLSHVATEATRPCLLVRAYHSGSGSCIGWLRVPIDSAKPTTFDPPLSQRVARWWPGVLRNLAAARSRPVWTVTGRQAASAPDDASADAVRSAVRTKLAGDSRIFLAEFAPLLDTQREVLIRLMGLSRPMAGGAGSAADRVVDVAPAGAEQVKVRLLDGLTLQVLDEGAIDGTDAAVLAGRAEAWLGPRLDRFAKSGPAPPAGGDAMDVQARQKQAKLELDRGLELARQWSAFRDEAEKRQLAKGIRSGLGPEDRQELARLAALSADCCDRAAQLDPGNEEAAFQSAWAKARNDYPTYVERIAAIEAVERFIASFPRSTHLGEMLLQAFMLDFTTASYVGRFLNEGAFGAPPPGIDVEKTARKLWLDHQRAAIRVLVHEAAKGHVADEYGSSGMAGFFARGLVRLRALKAPQAELDGLIEEYAKAADNLPNAAAASDFMRLRLLAAQRDRDGYQRALAELRKRWPNAEDPHWKLAERLLATDKELLGSADH